MMATPLKAIPGVQSNDQRGIQSTASKDTTAVVSSELQDTMYSISKHPCRHVHPQKIIYNYIYKLEVWGPPGPDILWEALQAF